MSLPPLIAAMLRPEFYPHHPDTVQLVQTHISFVLLAGPEVYKVKKAVRFPFLDFSTLERRRHFCHEEVRLNRRLAPEVYRGVVALCADATGYRIGPSDDPAAVDYAVHMQRLPEDRILARLLDHHAVTPGMIDAVAARLVEFHRRAATDAVVTANGDPRAIAKVLQDNFTAVRPFRDVIISAGDDDAIQRFCRNFLDRRVSLLRQRQVTHRIRECHGDLHSEHVCFTDSLVIFDCIEFNQRFRSCDVAAEVAFLAMDLDYHGEPELAARLISQYAARADDPDLARLVPFYKCQRAYVRGMVDSLTSAEEEVAAGERERAARGARRHFALAYRYTWSYSPALVVVCGLSGTGKSTVAIGLQSRTGFVHLSSDVIRKQLAGLPPEARPAVEYAMDIYTPAYSARTYREMFNRAAAALAGGRGVILDATFQGREQRKTARQLARDAQVPILFVECTCGEDLIRQRLGERGARGTDASDATWNVYVEQRERYESFTPREQRDHLRLDTAATPVDLVAIVERVLRRRVGEV